jgi:hypothetical protein
VAELIASLPNAEKCIHYRGADASVREIKTRRKRKKTVEPEPDQNALIFEQELAPRIGKYLSLALSHTHTHTHTLNMLNTLNKTNTYAFSLSFTSYNLTILLNNSIIFSFPSTL